MTHKIDPLLRNNRRNNRYKKLGKLRFRLFWWKCYGYEGIIRLEAYKRRDKHLSGTSKSYTIEEAHISIRKKRNQLEHL